MKQKPPLPLLLAPGADRSFEVRGLEPGVLQLVHVGPWRGFTRGFYRLDLSSSAPRIVRSHWAPGVSCRDPYVEAGGFMKSRNPGLYEVALDLLAIGVQAEGSVFFFLGLCCCESLFARSIRDSRSDDALRPPLQNCAVAREPLTPLQCKQ